MQCKTKSYYFLLIYTQIHLHMDFFCFYRNNLSSSLTKLFDLSKKFIAIMFNSRPNTKFDNVGESKINFVINSYRIDLLSDEVSHCCINYVNGYIVNSDYFLVFQHPNPLSMYSKPLRHNSTTSSLN